MKLDLRSLVIGVFIGSIGLTTVFGAVKNKNIEVFYKIGHVAVQDNDIIFSEDNEPFVYNGVAYAPIRDIAENIGCDVSFRADDNSIYIYSKDSGKVGLLTKAMQNIGAVSPESAVDIWSKGLETRNAALQYCVMTETLKENYVKSLEKNDYDYWITGVSSPWIDNYEVLKTNVPGDNTYEYELKYNTSTSEGSYYFTVALKLVKEGDYWKISDINGDKESELYTGFVK